MTRVTRLAWRIGLLLLALYAVLAGLGLLITRADTRDNPLTEDDLTRWLAERRTGFLDSVTSVLVDIGAPVFVGLATVVGVVVLRLTLGRWREPVFLVVTVAAQAVLVALTAQVASRDAPDVTRLGEVSAGASYPSAHTAAATALLVAATLLVGWYVGPPRIRVPVLVVLIVLPVLVGYAELYRGLHHLTDVLAGYLAGLGAVAIATRTVLNHRLWAAQPDHRVRRRHDGHPARAAVIYNPTKVPDIAALRSRIEAHMARAGWAEPLWLGTTVDDPGAGMCAAAAKEKADLIIVCGGDGTVRVCAGALAGTDMPMALIPAGTGNLLARNLGIPLDEDGAMRVALSGADRRIDVASIENHKFVVMAGLGFDAAIMRDASEGLKRAVGWPAYVVSGARHLRGRGIRVRVTLDDGEPFSRRVRTAVVGNVGKLLAGIPLLPDAEPDDGVLDLVLLAPASIVGWARVAGRVLSRRRGGVDRRVERFRATHVLLETSQPQPRQLDGDLIEDGRTMDIRIEPAAVSVRVPTSRRNR